MAQRQLRLSLHLVCASCVWCLLGLAVAGGADSGGGGGHSVRGITEALSTMSHHELLQRFGSLSPRGPTPTHQDKIDHFVVLYMENRAFDHVFGCHDVPGLDGIIGHTIPVDPQDPSKGVVNVTCGTAKMVCDPGPSMGMWAQHFGNSSCTHKYPYCGPGAQSDKFSVKGGGLKQGASVEMFSPEQLPIKTELRKQFGLFNKYFTATPTASTPNHLFAQSATSCGQTGNSLYSTCGGGNETYPQSTIYDNMHLNNVSFTLYMNNTGAPEWPSAYLTPVDMPDIILQGVARYTVRFIENE
jgi:phospholipase C